MYASNISDMNLETTSTRREDRHLFNLRQNYLNLSYSDLLNAEIYYSKNTHSGNDNQNPLY